MASDCHTSSVDSTVSHFGGNLRAVIILFEKEDGPYRGFG